LFADVELGSAVFADGSALGVGSGAALDDGSGAALGDGSGEATGSPAPGEGCGPPLDTRMITVTSPTAAAATTALACRRSHDGCGSASRASASSETTGPASPEGIALGNLLAAPSDVGEVRDAADAGDAGALGGAVLAGAMAGAAGTWLSRPPSGGSDVRISRLRRASRSSTSRAPT
jgi:hypothetical protein